MARVLHALRLYSSPVCIRRPETTCLVVEVKRKYSGSSKGEKVLEVDVAGRKLKFSSGKYAKLADGAVVAQLDDTSVLVTAVSEEEIKEGATFLPLTVDYREKAAAAGRIPYNFFRRELSPMERELLTSRIIDRSIRPMFPEGYSHNTQIICSLLSISHYQDQEVVSINGASAALMLSDIPWNGPIAAVRVITNEKGELIINPTKTQAIDSDLNIILACTADRIIMVEGHGKEVSEDVFCEAVRVGMDGAQGLLQNLAQLRTKDARNTTLQLPGTELIDSVNEYCSERIMDIFNDHSHSKISRDKELFKLRDEFAADLKEKGTIFPSFLINKSFWNTAKKCMEMLILDKKIRCDGRGMHDVRPIECEVDLFELLHGSAHFTRGETQVMSTVTLDSPEHAARADEISLLIGAERSRNFMIHYDFPPFANNRTGRFMMAGRREVGHGALAERALRSLLPPDFPFTVRVTTQVTASSGSSSMATVCGSSLALFDAGVPMTKAAAGVACGLIVDSREDSCDGFPRYQFLSDITGIEDALGCMDFKMAGTKDGITACQVDVKNCTGLPYELFKEAVYQSRDARLRVLDVMNNCQDSPRPFLKENGPVYETITVPKYKRNKVIGMGGHKIRPLIQETGVRLKTIGTEEMSIFAPSRAILEDVKEKIFEMMNAEDDDDLEVGSIYNCRIADIRNYGFMITLLPSNATALLHSNELAHSPSFPLAMGYKVGDEIEVKYMGKDELTGRLNVSRKALLTPPTYTAPMGAELVEGKAYNSVICDVRNYGVMLQLQPSEEKVLLHASNMGHGRVYPMMEGYNVGDEMEVQYMGRDEDSGRHLVSRKALLDPPPQIDLVVGTVYNSVICDVRSYGLLIKLQPSGERMLLHATNIGHGKVYPLAEGYKVGEEIEVKYMGKDGNTGRHLVSRKALLDPPTSVKQPVDDLVVGTVYNSVIRDVRNYGVMVNLQPSGVKMLLHATNMGHGKVYPLLEGYKVGEEIEVKYMGKDDNTGRHLVSRKALLDPPTSVKQPVDLVVGIVYNSVICDVRSYGVMIKVQPSEEKMLLHATNMGHERVYPLLDGYKVGEEIEVKYMGKDGDTGRHLVSRKALLDPPTSVNEDKLKQAPAAILKVGEVYKCHIKEIKVYGMMVELLPSGVKTLLHASMIDHYLVNPTKMGYTLGQEMEVKYLGKDKRTGRLVVSRKALLDPFKSNDNLVNGNIYSARITDVKHYGFMLQLLPDSVSTSCLLHASQVDKGFVDPFKYGYKKGDEISVKYLGRNKLTGRLEVSRKALLAPPPLKKKGRGQTTGEKGHVTGGCVVKEEVPIDTIDKDITDKQDIRFDMPHPPQSGGGVWSAVRQAIKSIVGGNHKDTSTNQDTPTSQDTPTRKSRE